MTAFQETQRLSFGSGRLYGTDSSGNVLTYLQLNDIMIDFKIDLKEAYGENSYPFGVADGHRQVDISAKHYMLDALALNQSLGGTSPTTTEGLFVLDEAQAVTSHTATLANTPTSIQKVLGNQGGNPIYYVKAVSAVSGVSYSQSGATLTFASGDTVSEIYVDYEYTAGSATGQSISITGTYQNSQPWMSLVAFKRDRSQVDSSTDYQMWVFNRVRDGGIKVNYKEGDYQIYERTFKAFTDPFGNLGSWTGFNA